MIGKLISRLARFRRKEDGSITVEFVIIFPAFMFLVLSGVELALVTLQQAMLDRAVDLTVREIRLGTGNNQSHDAIRDTICDHATFIKNCSANLRLEMIQQSAFAGIDIPATPDCTNNSEEVSPVREFQNGLANELMILRACAKIDPVFPTSTMGRTLADDTGQIALTATTAFVQEPT